MNRIKELMEARGAKLKEARAILDKAIAEKRNLTADENGKVDTLCNEAEATEKTLAAEVRQASLESLRAPELSHSEKRTIDTFDFGSMLRSLKEGRPLEGAEREITEEGAREARNSGIEGRTGIMLPRCYVRRENRDMTATGTTGTSLDQGGQTIATSVQGFFDAFVNKSVIRQAGAMVFENVIGNLNLPRMVAGADPLKKTENEGATESSPTVATLSLTPKRLPSFVDLSDQLLRQSSTTIELWVGRQLEKQALAVMELAFINGGGTSEATGILQTTGIGAVTGGTNGAAPDWNDIVDLETEVSIDNADSGSLHYLTNCKVRGKLKKTLITTTYGDRMVWQGNDLNGYVPLVTNAMPCTLTKGTSSVASAIIFGNFADYAMAFWGGIGIELMRDITSAKLGQSTLVLQLFYDGGVIRPVSFAAMKDALTA